MSRCKGNKRLDLSINVKYNKPVKLKMVCDINPQVFFFKSFLNVMKLGDFYGIMYVNTKQIEVMIRAC